MIYKYTRDLPYLNSEENLRAFTKLPRSILLPPYLASNPYYVEFVDSIDEVFDYQVEAKLDALRNIRNMWVNTKTTVEKTETGKMIEFIDWGGPERETLVKQVNQLGMRLSNAGVVSDASYRTIAKFIGSYWFEKGKSTCMDFLNFVLGTQFLISKMWTSDYVDFFNEGDTKIQGTIFDSPPGSWYPTTHVSITMPGAYTIDPVILTSLFYDIANYNLVLRVITNFYNCSFGTVNSDIANIVCVGLNQVDTISLYSPKYIVNSDLTITEVP